MDTVDNVDSRLVAAVRSSLKPTAHFPANVFTESLCAGYWFFDVDWLVDDEFVGLVQRILSIEGCAAAGVVQVDSLEQQNPLLFVITPSTTPMAYRRFLMGDSPETGWLYGVARLACGSPSGNWCIYGERTEDLGVVAVKRQQYASEMVTEFQSRNWKPIDASLADPTIYAFSNAARLSDKDRADFLREYSSQSRLGE